MGVEGMSFHDNVRNIVISAGMYITDAETFVGSIKKVRASSNDNYFTFKRNNRDILVKSLEQKMSGSAADKIAMFYLNLQETPYDVVLIVADNTMVAMFDPLIDFFQKRQMELDNVKIMTISDFEKFVTKTI